VGKKVLEMPIELYFRLQGDLHTSQTLQEALRDIFIIALLHLFFEFNNHSTGILCSNILYSMRDSIEPYCLTTFEVGILAFTIWKSKLESLVGQIQ